MPVRITLQYGDDIFPQPEYPSLEQFTEWGKLIPDNAEIGVRVVSNREVARLNQKYRGQSGATNVLSFAYDSQGRESLYLGDIVMAAALIAKEAKQQNKSLDQHWAHLFIHGMLHLQGYHHNDEEHAYEMETQEIDMMHRLGFPDPYQPILTSK